MTGMREDMFRVTLTIDGADWGVWDQRTGGKSAGNTVMYKPGGMEPQVALGGVATTDAVSLVRNYRHQRDHDRVQTLYDRVGKGACVVKALPLDADGNAYGNPIIWQGLLESVDAPSVNSESTAAAMVTLEIAPDGKPTS